MDEPTSALGEAEAEHLFAAIGRLKARGKGIIYVSHRLSEIFQIADTYTVFRDGRFVAGRRARRHRQGRADPADRRPPADARNSSRRTCRAPNRSCASCAASPQRTGSRTSTSTSAQGEILGLYGLMGSGRTEIFDRLFGLDPRSGRRPVEVDGAPMAIASSGRGHRRGHRLCHRGPQGIRPRALRPRFATISASPRSTELRRGPMMSHAP